MNDLTHLDSEGRARMVDVSVKTDTTRIAVAAGQLMTTPAVVALVRADDLPKADVLATARIAGISGAKKTSELIPLCHQLALASVNVEFGFTDSAITIEATAKTKGPTGVEMEALTAVAVAGLTLHDMVKAVDPAAVLDGVRLLEKEGGKRGRWTREQPSTGAARDLSTVTPKSSAVVNLPSYPTVCGTDGPSSTISSSRSPEEDSTKSELLAAISNQPLDPAVVDAAVAGPEHGAVVTFTGVVRNHDEGLPVSALEYSAHPDVERFLRTCCEEVSASTGLRVAAVHRVGALTIGDLAVVAAVAAPHRAEAFAACAELVERIKHEVPIWKRQHFADGASEWVGL